VAARERILVLVPKSVRRYAAPVIAIANRTTAVPDPTVSPKSDACVGVDMAQRTRIVIETEQVHLLSVSGALDREGLRELRKHLGALYDAGVRLIMADLCRVTSCDGRLFAVLVQSDHLLTRRGGWLRLAGLGPAVLDALDQATLPEVLLVYRASDQASRGVGECTARS